jgi:hypothetical protein
MSFSPQLFLSNIKNKDGLARTNRFEVILPIPPYISKFVSQSILEQILNIPNNIVANFSDAITGRGRDVQSQSANPSMSRYLALQCEAAELPGKTLQTADVKVYGPTFKVPYQTQYSDITLTFLCTNEFYERKLFDRWLEAIMPTDTNNMRYSKDESTRYMTNISVIQYDDFIKKIYVIELVDAFPIGIAPQTLSWADDGFHRLGIQFAYQKYNVKYEGEYDLVAAASALFGAKAASLFDAGGRSFSDAIARIF